MDNVELLPCPLCGGKATAQVATNGYSQWWMVTCLECHTRQEDWRHDHKHQAIEKWNKRVPTPSPKGRWVRYHEADFGWDEWGYKCSCCGLEIEDGSSNSGTVLPNYCPNCGVRMK